MAVRGGAGWGGMVRMVRMGWGGMGRDGVGWPVALGWMVLDETGWDGMGGRGSVSKG